MKTPIYLSVLLGLFLFAGCGPSDSEKADAGLSSQPPAELVKSAIKETGEFNFCVSEEAGPETLKDSADRMHKIVEALADSVNASELDDSKKAQVSQTIASLETACVDLATSAESQATRKELLKANSKIRSELISISKVLR